MVLYCIIPRDAFNAFSFSYLGALGLCDITISVIWRCQKSFHFMLCSIDYFLLLQITHCNIVERRESQEPLAKPLLTFKRKWEEYSDSDVTSVYFVKTLHSIAGYGQKSKLHLFWWILWLWFESWLLFFQNITGLKMHLFMYFYAFSAKQCSFCFVYLSQLMLSYIHAYVEEGIYPLAVALACV